MPNTQRWQPFAPAVPFTTIVTGLFNLGDLLPTPLALLAGAAWGVALGLLLTWLRRYPTASARLEDTLVAATTTAVAFAACGGLMALRMLAGALESPTLTGETLLALFLPTIPYYIVVNQVLEVLLFPALLVVGWRAGRRRPLLVAAAAVYFLMRVWTYLRFVPARLGFAEEAHTGAALTAAERTQAYDELMVDDPRWIVLLVVLALLLLAAQLPRVRERAAAVSGTAPR